jgi:hypothetical protein
MFKTRYRAQKTTRTQCPQKIHTWAGILNNIIIGQFEMEGNNSATYLDLLVTKY